MPPSRLQKWIGHSLFPFFYLGGLLLLGLLTFFGPLQWILVGFNILLLYIACFFLLSYFEWETQPVPTLVKWPMLSILIPAYNRGESLRTCLQHVLAMEYPGKKEIIVLNDASTDQTREILKTFEGKIQIIHFKKNQGKARILNHGLTLVKGTFVAVIDGDSYPRKDAFLYAIPHLVTQEKIGAVTTIVRVHNNHGWLPRIQEMEYFLSFGLHNNMLSSHDGVYVTPGPFTVYRKKALDEMGGYDIHNITEDMEITFHLHAIGYQVLVEPRAQVYTDVPDTLPKLWRQRNRWSYGSWQTMFKYRKELFSPTKSFFYFFFPQRLIMEGSSVIFLFMLIRMGADAFNQITQTYFSWASIGFEQIAVPSFYVTGTLFLYWTLILMWVVLLALGIHIARASFDWRSLPSLIIFVTAYGLFIITVQAYSLARVVMGGKQAW
ncbi:MAG: glycosyltransferase family 2 protein [Candidatus Diapherotrites archaeon]|nr:glycosyltransferase family 2 protein [Candidatus Diapherotrites archaeon]MDZ4256344.1 glycosyltransferase family 2 protein [archaeon]